jgi:hypothetical protein
MEPRWLFPLLAAAFLAVAVMTSLRTPRSRGALRAWSLLALMFALVSLWLHLA